MNKWINKNLHSREVIWCKSTRHHEAQLRHRAALRDCWRRQKWTKPVQELPSKMTVTRSFSRSWWKHPAGCKAFCFSFMRIQSFYGNARMNVPRAYFWWKHIMLLFHVKLDIMSVCCVQHWHNRWFKFSPSMKLQKGYVDLKMSPVANTTKWWVVSTNAGRAMLLKKKEECIPKVAKQTMLQSFGRFCHFISNKQWDWKLTAGHTEL